MKKNGEPLKPYELDALRVKADPPHELPLNRLVSESEPMSQAKREALTKVLDNLRDRKIIRW